MESGGATGVDGGFTSPPRVFSGAAYVYVRDASGVWNLQAYVKATNPGEDDFFGWSVALSGDGGTLAVGAPLEDSGTSGVAATLIGEGAENSGAAYLYARSAAGAWSPVTAVKAVSPAAFDSFGWSLALSADGSTLAVGAPAEDGARSGVVSDRGTGEAMDSGAAYVYARTASGAWTHQAYVKASITDSEDHFGWALALSADGSTLAVGTYLEDSGVAGAPAPSSGAVEVYVRDGTAAWAHQAFLKAPNGESGDWFGHAVAPSGDGGTPVAGAPFEDSSATGIGGNQASNAAQGSGAVYLFRRETNGAWTPRSYVKASNTGPGDTFGAAVALSADGGTLAVGAPGEASSATGVGGDLNDGTAPGSGAVYLY
jgi:trimeric autotransporter adhesin